MNPERSPFRSYWHHAMYENKLLGNEKTAVTEYYAGHNDRPYMKYLPDLFATDHPRIHPVFQDGDPWKT